ncbi:MAG: hypothetical protein AAF483_11460 [Planctomycetota bacterium]
MHRSTTTTFWLILLCLFSSWQRSLAQETDSVEERKVVPAPRALDFDVIPESAVVAMIFRDPQDAVRKLISLTQRSKGQAASLFSIASSFGPQIIRDASKMGESLDFSGTAAVLYVDAPAETVLMFPYTSIRELANTFVLDDADLQAGKIVSCREDFGFIDVDSMGVRGKHAVFGSKEALEKVLKAKGIGQQLNEETRQLFQFDDFVLTADLVQVREIEDDAFQDFLFDDWQELARAGELQRFTTGLRVGEEGERFRDAINVTNMLEFDGPKSKELLKRLKRESRPSDLQGLPMGKVVMAMARSNGKDCGGMLYGIIEEGMPFLGEEFEFSKLSPRLMSFIEALGEEAFQRVQSSRLALYQSERPEEHGSFSLVAILDVDDSAAFMQDVQDLIPLFDAALYSNQNAEDQNPELEIDPVLLEKMLSFLGHPNKRAEEFMMAKLRVLGRPVLSELRKVAQSQDEDKSTAAQELVKTIEEDFAQENADFLRGTLDASFRPHLGFVPELEVQSSMPVSAIQLSFDRADKGIARQLLAQLGPDWNKIRIARLDTQIVVMLGSDVGMLEETIQSLQTGAEGLNGKKHFSEFHAFEPDELMAELHFSLPAAQILTDNFWGNRGRNLKFVSPSDTPSSIGVSVGDQHLQLDLFIPSAEINLLQDLW